MRKVLLVEDSKECQLATKHALSRLELELVTAETLSEAKRLIASSARAEIDLILLDLGLPDGDGLQILDLIQADRELADIPVILLTGKDDLASKIAAFNVGADEYLVKPMNALELRARIETRLRKRSARLVSDVIRKGSLQLNIPLMKASIEGTQGPDSVELTAMQFKLLTFLVQNEGHAFSRPELVRSIWGKSVHILDRTVDSHICAIRRKLGAFGSNVQCIPAVGYRFTMEKAPSDAF